MARLPYNKKPRGAGAPVAEPTISIGQNGSDTWRLEEGRTNTRLRHAAYCGVQPGDMCVLLSHDCTSFQHNGE